MISRLVLTVLLVVNEFRVGLMLRLCSVRRIEAKSTNAASSGDQSVECCSRPFLKNTLDVKSQCAQASYIFLEMLHVQSRLLPRLPFRNGRRPRSTYPKLVGLRAVIRIPCSRPCIFMATFGATTRLTVIFCGSKVCSVRGGKNQISQRR